MLNELELLALATEEHWRPSLHNGNGAQSFDAHCNDPERHTHMLCPDVGWKTSLSCNSTDQMCWPAMTLHRHWQLWQNAGSAGALCCAQACLVAAESSSRQTWPASCAAAGFAEPFLRQLCARRYDAAQHAFVASIGSEQLLLDPATVRRNDTSAKSINEWTGEKMSRDSDVPEDIKPESVAALGNYAVQILWQDGFNQVSIGWPLVWQSYMCDALK